MRGFLSRRQASQGDAISLTLFHDGGAQMKVEKTIQISAAPEKVWPFLVEPEKIVQWFDSFKKCEITSDQHSGPGTTYYVEEKVPGPLRKISFKATAWEEGEKLTLKMVSGVNVSDYEIRFKLADSQAGTVFDFKEEVGMPFGPLGKLLGALGQKTADRMVENMLLKLKERCE
jgi:uncharacterized protein YndB with AHSA1/START domain